MNIVIGVDAGGTKTSAAAYDEAGREVARCKSGPGNFSTDAALAAHNVAEALDGCRRACSGRCRGILIGAAGMRGYDGKERLVRKLEARFSCPVVPTDDGALALYAALGAEDGVLVISGTGSIAYGRCGEKLQSRGGWGHLLDDRGSGYEIAIRAFRLMTEDYDDGRDLSPLSAALLEWSGVSRVKEIAAFLQRISKREIAAAVPAIERMALSGDTAAMRLLNDAGERLTEIALPLIRSMGLEKPRVAVSGSVLLKSSPVADAFWKRISMDYAEYTRVRFDGAPEIGAYYWFRSARQRND